MPKADDRPKQLFLEGQQFRELLGIDDPDDRRYFVCGVGNAPGSETRAGREKDPWQTVARSDVRARAAGAEPWRRVALVCDAGLGKTTTTWWLATALALEHRSQQIPLRIRLDRPLGRKLLRQEHQHGEAFTRRLARELLHTPAGRGQRARCVAAVRRAQQSGHITLLIDGLDHALADPAVAAMLAELCDSDEWRRCPVWIAGRPYAFNTCWGELIQNTADWHFLRIEPLTEPDTRRYLSWRMQAFRDLGIDWLEGIAEGGRGLLCVPRFLQLIAAILHRTVSAAVVRKKDPLEALDGLDLQTKADVYHQAYFHVGTYHDLDSRGLLGQGLMGVAERLGLHSEEPDEDNYPERVHRMGVLLAALAFELYGWKRKPRPAPVDGVLAEDRGILKERVARRLVKAGLGTRRQFLADFRLLTKMNNRTVDFLLFKYVGRNGLVFHDQTVQAFFAAHWATRYGTPGDRARVQTWVIDATGKRLADFNEFWQFAAEMPDALISKGHWLQIFTPCYAEPRTVTGPFQCVQWHHEMIYHSFPRMERRSGNTIAVWRTVSRTLQAGNGEPEQQRIHDEFMHGFLPIPAGVCHYGADPLHGNPGVEIIVGAFRLHRWPVTNEMYELFDPTHFDDRWRGNEVHPLAGEDGCGDSRCPVVNVMWYDAWCFGRWLGEYRFEDGKYKIQLPTELQREHAERAGTAWAWFFGDDEAQLGRYAHYGQHWQTGSTRPVDEAVGGVPARLPNAHALSDMAGNVWEWCADWDDARDSARVLRGGSWFTPGGFCQSAFRLRYEPSIWLYFIGFRLAAVPDVGAEQGSRGQERRPRSRPE
jgi:formylglycine-generating enzyme required for sulfatase activity